MFDLKHQNQALWNGQYGGPQITLHTTAGDRVYAFTRTRGDNTVLVAVNFGNAPVSASYTGLTRAGQYTDWFSKARVQLGPAGVLEIPAHGYRILTLSS
jgi:hypothetical protein